MAVGSPYIGILDTMYKKLASDIVDFICDCSGQDTDDLFGPTTKEVEDGIAELIKKAMNKQEQNKEVLPQNE